MTPTDNLEPITEEELREAEEVYFYTSECRNLFPRLLNGYREVKEKLAEKERVIERMRKSLEFYASIKSVAGKEARRCLEEVKGDAE